MDFKICGIDDIHEAKVVSGAWPLALSVVEVT